ncbi:OTU domain-containing protein [Roseiconus lacunae]|uniref:OTU domain-containing protein n=1 Tax=Roseiconus lacunae TaxID=2605694 RepID=UPI001E40F3C0|nr:OTU domain-containing protein [Roseiconus lacunae]MCD0457908.1 hypothetical protein [Roseiconus lacunae]
MSVSSIRLNLSDPQQASQSLSEIAQQLPNSQILFRKDAQGYLAVPASQKKGIKSYCNDEVGEKLASLFGAGGTQLAKSLNKRFCGFKIKQAIDSSRLGSFAMANHFADQLQTRVRDRYQLRSILRPTREQVFSDIKQLRMDGPTMSRAAIEQTYREILEKIDVRIPVREKPKPATNSKALPPSLQNQPWAKVAWEIMSKSLSPSDFKGLVDLEILTQNTANQWVTHYIDKPEQTVAHAKEIVSTQNTKNFWIQQAVESIDQKLVDDNKEMDTNFRRQPINGDGDCFYAAAAKQTKFSNSEIRDFVHAEAVKVLKEGNRIELFDGYQCFQVGKANIACQDLEHDVQNENIKSNSQPSSASRRERFADLTYAALLAKALQRPVSVYAYSMLNKDTEVRTFGDEYKTEPIRLTYNAFNHFDAVLANDAMQD